MSKKKTTTTKKATKPATKKTTTKQKTTGKNTAVTKNSVKKPVSTKRKTPAAPLSGRNRFCGVDDVYLTPKSIAVVRIETSGSATKGYTYKEKRTYYPKTSKNLQQAREVLGEVRRRR